MFWMKIKLWFGAREKAKAKDNDIHSANSLSQTCMDNAKVVQMRNCWECSNFTFIHMKTCDARMTPMKHWQSPGHVCTKSLCRNPLSRLLLTFRPRKMFVWHTRVYLGSVIFARWEDILLWWNFLHRPSRIGFRFKGETTPSPGSLEPSNTEVSMLLNVVVEHKTMN